jgi:triacylglycerol lipase
MAGQVLSLTTLGTPHQGTSIAELNVLLAGGLLEILDAAGLGDFRGFFELPHGLSDIFARKGITDDLRVKYCFVAGDYEPGLLSADLLRPTHDIIRPLQGANDGLVPVASATMRTFGTFLGTWPGDHFRLINWATNVVGPFAELDDDSVVNRYLDLVGRLG